MEDIMTAAIFLTILIYCIWLLIMLFGWLNRNQEKLDTSCDFFVAVIIPFRNEAAQLSRLIHSLKSLKYDHAKLEILLVNDHSTDNYEDTLVDLPPHIKVLHLDNQHEGKKAAITYGVKHTTAEIIVTSDADCEFHTHWIHYLTNPFSLEDVHLVFGGIRLAPSNHWLSRFQVIEFAPLIGVGGASATLGLPFMCNGANLAFRRNTFLEVKGYRGNEHLATGDDEFLLYKISRRKECKIYFQNHVNSTVSTNTKSTVSSFYQQRKRWASKWSSHLHWYKLLIGILVFSNAFASLAAYFSLFTVSPNYILAALIVKLVLEGIFIYAVLRSLKSTFRFFDFIMVHLIYPFYTIFMTLTSFNRGYTWKGRRH